MQVGVDIGSFVFNKTSKTITFFGIAVNDIQEIGLIVDPAASNGDDTDIFNPAAGPAKFGVLANNVLTLTHNTNNANYTNDDDGSRLHVCVNQPTKETFDLFDNKTVAQLFTVFDVTFENHKQIDLWEFIGTGTFTDGYDATIGPFFGARFLEIGTDIGDKAVLVQHGYNQFIEGKPFEITVVHANGPQKAGLVQRAGYFDSNSGWFFVQTENDYQCCFRTSVSGAPVDEEIVSADWNIDKLDGTGISGLDIATNIDLQLFGRWKIFTQGTVGRSEFGIEYQGKLHKIHYFDNGFTGAMPYVERASLPIRWEIENVAATASVSRMDIQACSVGIRGEYDVTGFPFSDSTDIITRVISARTALISLRIADLFGPGQKPPRGVMKVSGLNISVSGGDVHWQLVLQKGHLGEVNIGGPPTYFGQHKSTVEIAIDGTTIPIPGAPGNGEAIKQGFAIAASGNNPGDRVAIAGNIVHNIALNDLGDISDTITLTGTPMGNNATVRVALEYTEFK